MKKLAVLLVLMLFAAVSSAEELPSEDLDRLNKESIKQFHIKHEGKGLSLSRGLSKPYPGTPEEAAEKFLKDYHRMFKLSEDLSELKFVRKGKQPKGIDIDYQKYYKGVPIHSTGAAMSLDAENRVYSFSINLIEIVDFNVEPVIKPDELQGVLEESAPQFGPIIGAPELIIYFVEGRPVLAYQFFTSTGEAYSKKSSWLIVDASTGKILRKDKGIAYGENPNQGLREGRNSPYSVPSAQNRKFSGYLPDNNLSIRGA